MNYIILTPELFLNEDRNISFEYLSQYCQLDTSHKFIYDGYISGRHHPELKFDNIVKANIIDSKDIVNQFPDLEEVITINYYPRNIPDIKNLKYCDYFILETNFIKKYDRLPYIKKYFDIFDETTLIINGKKLNVNTYWQIDSIINSSGMSVSITRHNYKQLNF